MVRRVAGSPLERELEKRIVVLGDRGVSSIPQWQSPFHRVGRTHRTIQTRQNLKVTSKEAFVVAVGPSRQGARLTSAPAMPCSPQNV